MKKNILLIISGTLLVLGVVLLILVEVTGTFTLPIWCYTGCFAISCLLSSFHWNRVRRNKED
ncbi:MAG: hypothetical protein J6X11_08345 [Treponema sp.]|nr:hypothetical protein [Treponema sp.]